MNALAPERVSRAQGSRTSLFPFVALVLVVGCQAVPASAEIGATASLFTDDRFRGYSLSDGRPVGILDVAYEDSSGFYADVSGTAAFKRDGRPAPLQVQLTGGYAKLLPSGATVDLGITGSTYSQYSSGPRGTSYTEVYAGISRGGFSTRLFLSPHYSERGLWTAYGEINGSISPADKWSIDGHVGVLRPLKAPAGPERYRTAYDWRIGVTRELGRVSLHAAWSEGARGRNYYNSRYSRGAVVIGASWVL